MEKRIEVALAEAVANGTHKVRITFKSDGQPGLFGLMAMANGNLITMLPQERLIAHAVTISGDWEQDANRTFTIKLLPSLRHGMFVVVMSSYLEKIAYARSKQSA